MKKHRDIVVCTPRIGFCRIHDRQNVYQRSDLPHVLVSLATPQFSRENAAV